jgi:mannose-1-phosphate guanylyltransferase
MNIILLSGGSGKRLWPLSNDIRSKQFIKIFKNDENELESMVQRVYRQITSVDKNSNITIATSKKQVSAIKNQLGDKVSICVEPARRDTFPAIALAANFLKDKCNVKENEAVVVCPVDPYVDIDYFEAVKNLSDLIENSSYNLNLMGVQPDYPSEKFGYIIPKENAKCAEVESFKEKPDEETAKEYISQGALWNCGVFGFKLGYLTDISHKLIDFENYDDLFAKYETLEKISFDYAVVEKEKSIQVMRFNGQWKDIGSWNTFAQEMHENLIGNCIINENCENTNIINELNIPVLAMGMKDTVIAASCDGILVSSKEESDKIKPFVDKMDNQAMFEEKSWGSYTVLDVEKGSMTVKIVLNKGRNLSYHSHESRDEVWTILSGKGLAIVDGKEKEVTSGDVISIKSGVKHTIFALDELQILEVQVGNEISDKDKIKYETDF